MASSTKERERKQRYEEKRKGQRTRCWACVIYPDSAPSNWRSILDNKHMPMLVSPEHNADVNADDTEKKNHRHVMVFFPGVASVMQAQAVFDGLNGTIPLAVHNAEAYARYLVHYDNPEKAQYKPEDIIAFGGANWYEVAFTQAAADDKLLDEIEEFITVTGLVSYALLCDYARTDRPEWKSTIRRRSTHIIAYMRAMLWESEGNPGKIPPRVEWEKLKKQDKERKEKIEDLVLEGFSERENEMRTKAGEFKD